MYILCVLAIPQQNKILVGQCCPMLAKLPSVFEFDEATQGGILTALRTLRPAGT
jgi:hypothetical protein